MSVRSADGAPSSARIISSVVSVPQCSVGRWDWGVVDGGSLAARRRTRDFFSRISLEVGHTGLDSLRTPAPWTAVVRKSDRGACSPGPAKRIPSKTDPCSGLDPIG